MSNQPKSLVVGAVALALGLVWPLSSGASEARSVSREGALDNPAVEEWGPSAAKGAKDPAGRLQCTGARSSLFAARGTISPGG